MKPLQFDVTHLRHNAGKAILSGIRRVDLEYAAHFLLDRTDCGAMQYGEFGPSVVNLRVVQDDIRRSKARLRAGDHPSDMLAAVTGWLQGRHFRAPPRTPVRDERLGEARSYLRFVTPPSRLGNTVARGSLYLNIAQHALFHEAFFRWLRVRRDVRAVFFVHDLLPFEQPEYWRAGYRDNFARGFTLWADVGAAFITATATIEQALRRRLAEAGRHDVPILAVPLPASFDDRGTQGTAVSEVLRHHPYFVMLGTIEPRKNHLLVLNAWRDLARHPGAPPKLIVAGRRGWENQQAAAMLDRCASIRPHVLEAADLTDGDLQRLIGNARGLLFPSFGEGYGLPPVEALSLGTPVIAADLPVLRETTQGRAIYVDPLDGPGWRAAIETLSDVDSVVARAARDRARQFRPLSATEYFAAVDAFLAAL